MVARLCVRVCFSAICEVLGFAQTIRMSPLEEAQVPLELYLKERGSDLGWAKVQNPQTAIRKSQSHHSYAILTVTHRIFGRHIVDVARNEGWRQGWHRYQELWDRGPGAVFRRARW